MKLNIIARKPLPSENGEWIVVDRGEGVLHRFVSATATPHSLQHGEWFWGHYFITQSEAMQHFNNR